MRERDAQIVLLVRAFEEADPSGRVLPDNARAAATSRALMVTGLRDHRGNLSEARNIKNGETVMRRARLLFDVLGRSRPALHGILMVARLGSGTLPLVVLAGLGFGLLSNILGPARRINLLYFPLVLLLAWNLFVYVVMVLRQVLDLVAPARDGQGLRVGELSSHMAGVLLKGAVWRRLHLWRTAGGGATSERRIITKALLRFSALWHRLATPLLASRVRTTLHFGAIATVLGAVCGMYLRGLVFDYDVSWQSTLLDAEDVGRILGVLLGPASWLLGIAIPDVAPLHGPDGAGDAAPWIHLYAVTVLLFVVLPRTAFALYSAWRTVQLSEAVPVELGDGYFRRLFVEWQGGHGVLELWPYSYHARPRALYAAKTLLLEFFGARTDVRVHEVLPYGAHAQGIRCGKRDASAGSSANAERYHVVLFNLAQTPEVEVHGRFLEDLKLQLDTEREQLLVVVDVALYRNRISDGERVRERAEAWNRLARDAGLGIVELDPETQVDDDALTVVGAALWPPRTGVGQDE
ncbi:MAG: DUF2868 domain-containing protein [bacterium]|nr:DUF2868 domain-containing protein [bacterium]